MAWSLAFKLARGAFRGGRDVAERGVSWNWRDGLHFRRKSRYGRSYDPWSLGGVGYAARRRRRGRRLSDEERAEIRERRAEARRQGRRIYQKELRKWAPRRHGRLRRSIRVRVRQNGNAIRLFARMLPYGYILNGRRIRISYSPDKSHKGPRYRYSFTRGWIDKARQRSARQLFILGIRSNL